MAVPACDTHRSLTGGGRLAAGEGAGRGQAARQPEWFSPGCREPQRRPATVAPSLCCRPGVPEGAAPQDGLSPGHQWIPGLPPRARPGCLLALGGGQMSAEWQRPAGGGELWTAGGAGQVCIPCWQRPSPGWSCAQCAPAPALRLPLGHTQRSLGSDPSGGWAPAPVLLPNGLTSCHLRADCFPTCLVPTHALPRGQLGALCPAPPPPGLEGQ